MSASEGDVFRRTACIREPSSTISTRIGIRGSGIRLLVDPKDLDPVSYVGIALIVLIGLGIDRSGELVGGPTAGVVGLFANRINGLDRGHHHDGADAGPPVTTEDEQREQGVGLG